ncbi:IPT/TIG domain-containing protein [Pandoraea vervacti]|uniref:IPT/TIG domain-containing protein n=1 Tax=Pandoraea vervacti TaxID=656178 RepID=UPI0009351CFE|nr:IPT/TIG domain-containing protein [Pandoraea vervacti]
MVSITNIELGSFSMTGGSAFTISGTGLSEVAQVHFIDAANKRNPAKTFTIVSDTKITGVFPALSAPGGVVVVLRVRRDATAAVSQTRTADDSPIVDPWEVHLQNQIAFVNQFHVGPVF